MPGYFRPRLLMGLLTLALVWTSSRPHEAPLRAADKPAPVVEAFAEKTKIKVPKDFHISGMMLNTAYSPDGSLIAIPAQDLNGGPEGYLIFGTAKGDLVTYLPTSVVGPGGWSYVVRSRRP